MKIISDLHFNHKKIIEYENRPFYSVEHMNEELIKNWNNIVKKRDEVWVLGDFCFGNFETTRDFCDRLNGRKHIVLGNHDGTHSYEWWFRAGFEFVSKHPVFYNSEFIFSHDQLSQVNIPPRVINVHGHIHSRFKVDYPYFNVSADAINFKPIYLSKIEDKFKEILYGC